MAKKAKKKVAKKELAKVETEEFVKDARVESLTTIAENCELGVLGDMTLKFGPQLGKVAERIRKIAESMQKAIVAKAAKESKKEATVKKFAEQMAKLQAKMESL